MNVSFIGSGNVAWHLAPALDNAGHVVKEVFSRHAQHAEALTNRLYQAEVKATLDFSTSPSRLFIVAVSDDALAEVAREVILPDEAILVHTSGSRPLDVLQFAAAAHTAPLAPHNSKFPDLSHQRNQLVVNSALLPCQIPINKLSSFIQ